jgi:hypothetical protein
MKTPLRILGIAFAICFVFLVRKHNQKQVNERLEIVEQMKYATDEELCELEKLIEMR